MDRLHTLLAIALIAGCAAATDEFPTDEQGDARDACFTCTDGKADRLSATPAEIAGVLRLVNTASRQELDVDAELDRRAANNIVDHRVATGDFETLEELDAVAYVGVGAFRRLLVYATAHGYLPGELVHGIEVGSAEAVALLDVANTSSLRELDDLARLDRRAAANIVDDRPFATLHALDAVSYVGATAFDRLHTYAAQTGAYCAAAATEAFVADLNSTRWPASFTRSIRTDLPLVDAIQSRNWPAQLTHAGCFGVRPVEVPRWIPVTAAEDGGRLNALFTAYGSAAGRVGNRTDVDSALSELQCATAGKTFRGCRFEFEPNPWSGITWDIIESDDGSVRYLFVGTWEE